MIHKEIKFMVSDYEQSVSIMQDTDNPGMVLVTEDQTPESKNEFITFLTYEEAKELGKELIRFSEENMKK